MTIAPHEAGVSDPLPQADRPITTLLSDLFSQAVLLAREEWALFSTELHQALSRVGQGAAALGAGLFIVLSGWLVLLAAAVLGLATVLPPWLAALIVALVMVGIGVALLLFGKSRLAPQSLVPRRTLRSLREDKAWLMERL